MPHLILSVDALLWAIVVTTAPLNQRLIHSLPNRCFPILKLSLVRRFFLLQRLSQPLPALHHSLGVCTLFTMSLLDLHRTILNYLRYSLPQHRATINLSTALLRSCFYRSRNVNVLENRLCSAIATTLAIIGDESDSILCYITLRIAYGLWAYLTILLWWYSAWSCLPRYFVWVDTITPRHLSGPGFYTTSLS